MAEVFGHGTPKSRVPNTSPFETEIPENETQNCTLAHPKDTDISCLGPVQNVLWGYDLVWTYEVPLTPYLEVPLCCFPTLEVPGSWDEVCCLLLCRSRFLSGDLDAWNR
jgi:hypothetical protein